MDPTGLYDERFHCWAPHKTYDLKGYVTQRRRRTELWPKYFIIDFGHSKRYLPDEIPPSEFPQYATDNSAPEFERSNVPCDPFPIDVYRFGNLLRMEFLDVSVRLLSLSHWTIEVVCLTNRFKGNPDGAVTSARPGFQFLGPLVTAMMRTNPIARPTMQQALQQFDEIISKIGSRKLRSVVPPPPRNAEDIVLGPPFSKSKARASFWGRRLKYALKGLPPVRPKS